MSPVAVAGPGKTGILRARPHGVEQGTREHPDRPPDLGVCCQVGGSSRQPAHGGEDH